jgi:hypothetical protein
VDPSVTDRGSRLDSSKNGVNNDYFASFRCPHFLPAVAVSTANYQQLLAPPVPRSRCNRC